MPFDCETEYLEHGHEHSHDHDHGHDSTPPEETNVTQSLYPYIDTTKVRIFNGCDHSKPEDFIKCQDDKFVVSSYLQSDIDCQLIIHIPFIGSCKLQSIILRTSTTQENPEMSAPKTIKLFKDWQKHIDFESLQHAKFSYKFEQPSVGVPLPISNETSTIVDDFTFIEHHIPKNKGSTVCKESITLYIEDNWQANSIDEDSPCRIYYLEIRGEFMGKQEKNRMVPPTIVYESRPQLEDHIGTEANSESQQSVANHTFYRMGI